MREQLRNTACPNYGEESYDAIKRRLGVDNWSAEVVGTPEQDPNSIVDYCRIFDSVGGFSSIGLSPGDILIINSLYAGRSTSSVGEWSPGGALLDEGEADGILSDLEEEPDTESVTSGDEIPDIFDSSDSQVVRAPTFLSSDPTDESSDDLDILADILEVIADAIN